MPDACELLGLSRNPFRTHPAPKAASVHVPHAASQRLLEAQRPWLAGEDGAAGAAVAIHGEPGAGRTHLLRLLAEQAAGARGFHALHTVAGARPEGLVARLASSLLAACPLGELGHAVAAPRWYRQLLPLARRTTPRGDPAANGEAIARALNDNAPAALLVDDVDLAPPGRAADAFLGTLEEARGHLGKGVLLAWTSQSVHLARVAARAPGLAHGAVPVGLGRLTDGEARRLLEVRLAAARTHDLGPLFPFTADAVPRMNDGVGGNPRRLLRLAELLVDAAARRGAFEVDRDRVEEVLAMPPGRRVAGTIPSVG